VPQPHACGRRNDNRGEHDRRQISNQFTDSVTRHRLDGVVYWSNRVWWDIALTPLGETFAEASILNRKEIFAGRLRRLPLFQWLLAMLEASNTHRLEYDVTMAALKLDLPPVEAERQLDIITSWGRYAELLAAQSQRYERGIPSYMNDESHGL